VAAIAVTISRAKRWRLPLSTHPGESRSRRIEAPIRGASVLLRHVPALPPLAFSRDGYIPFAAINMGRFAPEQQIAYTTTSNRGRVCAYHVRDATRSANSICDNTLPPAASRLLVGCCVRDLPARARTPPITDVATDATPEQVMGLFPEARGGGAQFGVI